MSLQPSANAEISGFYGPGPWAAWVITLTISWINIVQNEYTHNMHFIGYALYTNGAAIDLIRQLILATKEQESLGHVNEALQQRLAASIAVVHVGIQAAMMQSVACFYKERHQTFDPKQPIRRCRHIVSIGLVIPVIAAWHASSLVRVDTLGFRAVVASLLPGLSILVHMLSNLFLTRNGGQPVSFLADLWIYAMLFTWACYVWGQTRPRIRLQFRRPGTSLVSGDVCAGTTCCFVPCAPQGMGEMDQIFSLVVPLSLFLYEFGSRMARVARKWVEFLLETELGSRVVRVVRIGIRYYYEGFNSYI